MAHGDDKKPARGIRAAIDPVDGSVHAEKSVFYLETNERAISSPIVTKGLVIGTCGFTANPKHCVAMKLSGGEWEEAWRIERSVRQGIRVHP